MSIWDLVGGLFKFGWLSRVPEPTTAHEDLFRSPHDDELVLHAHGVCRQCDQFPLRQRGRVMQRINFTGEHEPGKARCPSLTRHQEPPQ